MLSTTPLRGYVRSVNAGQPDAWSARLIVAEAADADRRTECVSFCWRA
jgi:hypothetical protein